MDCLLRGNFVVVGGAPQSFMYSTSPGALMMYAAGLFTSAAPSFSFSRPASSMHSGLVPEAIHKDRLSSCDIAGFVHLAREGTSVASEALLPRRSKERLKKKKKNLCQSVGGGESKASPLWGDITWQVSLSSWLLYFCLRFRICVTSLSLALV